MMSSFSTRTHWLLILIVALNARLIAGQWWQLRLPEGTQFFFGDSATYWELARTIAAGEDYQYLNADARVLRTPGYPLLLAPLFWIFGPSPPIWSARVLSALCGTLSVGIVGAWGTWLFTARAGVVAGWLAALYPGSIALGVFVLSEAPFCPLMLAQLALWGAAWQINTQSRAAGWSAVAGFVGAAATLMRPSWLLFTPFAWGLNLLFSARRRRNLILGSAMCAALAFGMAGWWIRNTLLTGHFVPTTLQVGASLYDGLHPGATGASDMRFVPAQVAAELIDPADEAENFELRVDQRMRREALSWAQANPGEAARLALVKFVRIWNLWPNEPGFQNPLVRWGVALTYVPLLALGLIGAWRYRRSGWAYVLPWLPAVYLTLLHVVFVGSLRYREPAMLALIVLAAGVLTGSSPAIVPTADKT